MISHLKGKKFVKAGRIQKLCKFYEISLRFLKFLDKWNIERYDYLVVNIQLTIS